MADATGHDPCPRAAHLEERHLVRPPRISSPPQRHDPPSPAPAAPAPVTDQGTGIYVYGVVAGAPEELVEGLTGMDAEAGVTLIHSGKVSALCTRVPLAEFGEEALQRNLIRLDWLEVTAVRHETVLDQLIGRAELIPFRLCTVFADASRVAAMLEAQRDVFRAALARLHGADQLPERFVIDGDGRGHEPTAEEVKRPRL